MTIFSIIRCGILSRVLKSKGDYLVNIQDLELSHDARHPRTSGRINHIKGSPLLGKRILMHSEISTLMPSDRKIMIRKNKVINGNGRVHALKECGFTGYIEVTEL